MHSLSSREDMSGTEIRFAVSCVDWGLDWGQTLTRALNRHSVKHMDLGAADKIIKLSSTARQLD